MLRVLLQPLRSPDRNLLRDDVTHSQVAVTLEPVTIVLCMEYVVGTASAECLVMTNATRISYAIEYIIGYAKNTLVVRATDADEAYALCRSELLRRGLVSASLQGTCRPASQMDIDRAILHSNELGSRLF